MVLYIISILGADIIIMMLNLFFWRQNYGWSALFVVVATILAMIGVIAIDGLFATVVRKMLPERWFDHNVNYHNASKKECKFYEKIGIKHWKDYVLEVGMATTNFSKKSVDEPANLEYIDRFILENNYGAIVHIACIVFGFLLLIPYPGMSKVTMALPAAVVNAILNYLPYMILRYNTNRLQRIRAVLVRKEARNSEKQN